MNRIAMLCLLALGHSAQAELVDIQWDAAGAYERSFSLAPGKFAEVCGKLPAGLQVRWNFDASTRMDFNIHYHVGKDVVFPTKLLAVASGQDVLSTQLEQDYCWMWSNKTAAAATLKIKLQR